jgi:hypothetical protein
MVMVMVMMLTPESGFKRQGSFNGKAAAAAAPAALSLLPAFLPLNGEVKRENSSLFFASVSMLIIPLFRPFLGSPEGLIGMEEQGFDGHSRFGGRSVCV